jgi:hypothetical protein
MPLCAERVNRKTTLGRSRPRIRQRNNGPVRFDLDPPVGVGPVRLGMTRDEAREALASLGDPREFNRGAGSYPGWMVQRASTVFVECGADGRVVSIELATPGFGQKNDDEVVFLGIDLFGLPAPEILAALEAQGVRLVESEGGSSFTAPDRVLALWRDGGPVGADGKPLYFEAALVAKPGYYD